MGFERRKGSADRPEGEALGQGRRRNPAGRGRQAEDRRDRPGPLAADREFKGDVTANAAGELPISWGKIGASGEASVEVGLDYYYDPPTSTPLYGAAVAQRIIDLPDPFDFASVWEAFQTRDLAGIAYRFNDKAKAKVDVALGVSGSFNEKVLAEAKLSLGASVSTNNAFNLSLRGLDKQGETRPVEIILVRSSANQAGIAVDIGVKVDFDASVVRLREILNKAVEKSDALLGEITPYLTPGTWLRERFGAEVDAAAKKLVDDPALADLRDALVKDIQSIAADRRTTGGDAADEVPEAVGEGGPEREDDSHRLRSSPAATTQVVAAHTEATSSISIERPTALSACTVAGQAADPPTRRSSAR